MSRGCFLLTTASLLCATLYYPTALALLSLPRVVKRHTVSTNPAPLRAKSLGEYIREAEASLGQQQLSDAEVELLLLAADGNGLTLPAALASSAQFAQIASSRCEQR